MITNQENVTKVCALAGFILLILALIFAWNSPATGFESSIYTSTPFPFWICLLLAIGAGIFIVISEIYHNNAKNNLWILGLLLIMISNIALLSLPIIRGYYLWNASGDTGEHIGIVQGLIQNGHIGKDVVYPFTHLFLAQVSEILDVGVIPIVMRVPILFDMLYMVFLYFAAKALLPRQEQILFACLAGAALIHGWFTAGVSPYSLGSLYFPMVLFLLIKSSSKPSLPWLILGLIMVLLLPLIHPILAITAIIILISLRISAGIIESKVRNRAVDSEYGAIKPSWGIIIILSFWTFTWISISSFTIWGEFYKNVEQALVGDSTNKIGAIINTINYAGSYGYSTISYFTRVYAVTLCYGILVLISFPILLKNISHELKLQKVTTLYGPLAVVTLAMIMLYFLNLRFSPSRLEIIIIVMLFFIVGFLLYEFYRWTINQTVTLRYIAIVLLGLFLFGTSLGGILKLYPSPYSYDISSQNTRSEITGMDWFLKQKDTTLFSAGWYFSPYRYADFLLTTEEKQNRNDYTIYNTKDLPFHLGYDIYSNLGSYFKNDIYVVLLPLNRKVYTEIYPAMAKIRLLPDDFNKLDQDVTVNKLYENGEFEVYYISPLK